MFNTNHHIYNNTDVQYVTKEVNVHRAPTDESIKILNEMTDKSLDNLLKTVHLHNNALNLSFSTMYNIMNDSVDCYIQGEFNGNRLTRKFSLYSYKSIDDKVKTIQDEITAMVSEYLYDKIISTSSANVLRTIVESR